MKLHVVFFTVCLIALISGEARGVVAEQGTVAFSRSWSADPSKASEASVRPSFPGKKETNPFTFWCFKSNGDRIPNCQISLASKAVSKSGGHDHTNAGQPLGSFSPKSGNTGSDVFRSSFTSPEISGFIDVKVSGSAPGYNITPGVFRLRIELPGLQSLAQGTNYLLVGQTKSHTSNHFGISGFNAKLAQLANLYTGEFPGGKLGYNDMSLPLGGLFDWKATWKSPHSEHRIGVNVDLPLRYFPAARRARVGQLAKSLKIKVLQEDAEHWHLTNLN
ncbi:MAG TPA: hypothetical protein VKM72_34130 [Thermoanaerobaculia bacterium]|nr:hypothetical protein [Thermoanaerobaculia bacterium]